MSISSDGILGAVKFEKDLAADLSAFSDAVRLDLNVDLGLMVRPCRSRVISGITVTTESDRDTGRSGWSSHSSTGGDETIFSLLGLSLRERRLPKDGREASDGALMVDMVLSAASSDGVDAIESLDTERDDMKPTSFSSSISCKLAASSLSPSSAGSSRISNGDRPSDDDCVPSLRHS